MIGRLKGTLIEKQAPHLLIDVGGVGYELQVSMYTYSQLPEINTQVILHTHFVAREDAQQLYGFIKTQERSLFRALIKVNGIGPKIALAILSSMEPDEFVKCVVEKNAVALQRLPGIGKKTAERLIVEMRDRLDDWQLQEVNVANAMTAFADGGRSPEQEAMSALLALGYKLPEARRAVSQVALLNLTSQEIIRLALRQLSGQVNA